VQPVKHGVLANSYLDRATGKVVLLLPDPLFDKDEIVKAPTIYDLAHAAGLKTAGIIWPASRNAKSLDWTVPDCGTKQLWDTYGTTSWMEELRKEGIWVDQQEPWVKGGGGVVSDHGFFGFTKTIYPGVALKKAGIETAKVVSQGGSAFVYLTDKKDAAREALLRIEGVRTVLEPSEYAKWGIVSPDKDPRMGD